MATRYVGAQGSMTEAASTITDELHAVSGNGTLATTNAAASPLTMTAAQALSGLLITTTAGAFALTLPTAALLVAAFVNAQVGSSFTFALVNKGDNTLTVTAGAGNTLGGHATATLPTLTTQIFNVKFTNVTAAAEAVTWTPLLKTAS